MSVCHLVFDEEQSSWVCTACGKIAEGNVAVVQDSVDHHVSLFCEPCSGEIGPREVAGAKTATNTQSTFALQIANQLRFLIEQNHDKTTLSTKLLSEWEWQLRTL